MGSIVGPPILLFGGIFMKKTYTKPTVEVIRFDKSEDIVTCSNECVVPGHPVHPTHPEHPIHPPKPPHPGRP